MSEESDMTDIRLAVEALRRTAVLVETLGKRELEVARREASVSEREQQIAEFKASVRAAS